MATQDHAPGNGVSRKINGPVTTPYRFVTVTGTDRQAKVVDAQNAAVLGVIESTTRADQELQKVYIDGVVWVEAGAAVADGDFVISDNVGRAITDPATGGVTAQVAGKACGSCAAAGAVIGVKLSPFAIKR